MTKIRILDSWAPKPPFRPPAEATFRIEKLPKNLKKYRLELHFGPKADFPHFMNFK